MNEDPTSSRYQREDPDVPEPPPVPSSHPAGKKRIQEALRIPVAFYAEALVGLMAVSAIYLVSAAITPAYGPVLTTLGAVVSLGSCLVRMVKRVIRS